MRSIFKSLVFFLVIASLGCSKQGKNDSTKNDSGNIETRSESGAELSNDFVEMQKEIASASDDLLSDKSSDEAIQSAPKGHGKQRDARAQRNSDLAGFHAESTKLLDQALDLASDWRQDTDSPPVELLRDLMRRSHVLTIIAMQRAQIGDVETTQKVLATIKRFNASEIAGTSPGLDESDALIALAMSYAVAGNPEAAEEALERMSHEGNFVVGQKDVLKAKAYVDICLTLARLRRTEDAMFYLDRLGKNATETDNPIVLGELGKAQLLLGKKQDCEETVADILAKSTVPGQRNKTQEALASLAICLAKTGDSVGAKAMLAKCDPVSIVADTARSELVAFHARTLNFREALVLAGEIQNEFLRARALFTVLDRQLLCGPVFAESAVRLTDLADEQLKAFRDTPTLFEQIQTDHAVAFAKWDLIDGGGDTQLARDDPFGNVKKLGNAATSLSAALAVEEALEADLPPEHEARIHLSKAVAQVMKGEKATSGQFTDAAIQACRVEDPSTQVDLLREVCREASQWDASDEIMAWIENQSKGKIRQSQNKIAKASPSNTELRSSDRAVALIGIAEGIRVQESIRRAAAQGIVVIGSNDEHRVESKDINQLWSDFVASFPADLATEKTDQSLLLKGDLQLLAVPSQDGVNIAIPPTLEGLRAWVTVVARSVFTNSEEISALIGLVEEPVQHAATFGRFQSLKRTSSLPDAWLVFSISESISTDPAKPISELIAELASEDDTTRAEAVAALVTAGELAIPPLIECSKSNQKNVRYAATLALGEIGRPALKQLRDLLWSRNPQTVEFACSAIRKIGPDAEEAVAELIVVMDREARGFYGFDFNNVMTVSSMALKEIGKPSVPPLVKEFQRKQYGVLHADIARTLGEIGPDSQPAVPAFLETLKDRNSPPLIKSYVASALGKIGQNAEEVVPCLIESLRDKNSNVKVAAVGALGRFGASAESSLPELNVLLDDSDEDIRRAAKSAINNIADAVRQRGNAQ